MPTTNLAIEATVSYPFSQGTIIKHTIIHWGFLGGTVAKNLPASAGDAGDVGSIPGSGRSSGVGNGNLLQYFCLEIPWTEEPGRL